MRSATAIVAVLATGAALLALAPSTSRAQNPADHAELYSDRFLPGPKDLELTPQNETRGKALALYYKAQTRIHDGDTAGAIKALKEALALDSGNLMLGLEAATLYAHEQKFDEARKLIENILKNNGDDYRTWKAVAGFYNQYWKEFKAEEDSGIHYAQRGLERFPGKAALYEALVNILVPRGRTEEAREFLAQGFSVQSEDPKFWIRMGNLARQLWPLDVSGDQRKRHLVLVNAVFRKALNFADDHPKALNAIGDFYSRSRQYDKAEGIYKKLLTLDFDELKVREKLAHIYNLTQKPDDALETLKAIVKAKPDNPRTQRKLGQEYQKRGKMKLAIEHFLEALELAQGDANEYTRVAGLLLGQDRMDDAANILRRGHKLYEDNIEICYTLALILADTKNFKEAIKMFEATEKAAAKDDKASLNMNFYFRYGAVCEDAGEFKRCETLMRRSISLAPENKPEEAAKAYNFLGYMWLERDEKIDEAGELIKEANRLEDKNPAYLDSLGWFYFKKEKYEDALKELQRAEKMLEKMDHEIADHIAQAYHKLGKHEEALTYIKKAAELSPDHEGIKKRLEDYSKAAKKP